MEAIAKGVEAFLALEKAGFPRDYIIKESGISGKFVDMISKIVPALANTNDHYEQSSQLQVLDTQNQVSNKHSAQYLPSSSDDYDPSDNLPFISYRSVPTEHLKCDQTHTHSPEETSDDFDMAEVQELLKAGPDSVSLNEVHQKKALLVAYINYQCEKERVIEQKLALMESELNEQKLKLPQREVQFIENEEKELLEEKELITQRLADIEVQLADLQKFKESSDADIVPIQHNIDELTVKIRLYTSKYKSTRNHINETEILLQRLCEIQFPNPIPPPLPSPPGLTTTSTKRQRSRRRKAKPKKVAKPKNATKSKKGKKS
ncbi:hypothetical protein CANCADRAFT_671 [Tortispora caseinolytica NRRL Y-17796]|uniref:Uncharacterized protein n=1 Tax=Tortispora caseinolytica NRRL Y-17796 TaxID=767744 RepID=A0A1E4TJZ3_9ASCO|nr:hypothetical protein CANCADRAFT_671 [Tortispora caseinolytica NRRL Y-17796]